jgi:hypothetical protein
MNGASSSGTGASRPVIAFTMDTAPGSSRCSADFFLTFHQLPAARRFL